MIAVDYVVVLWRLSYGSGLRKRGRGGQGLKMLLLFSLENKTLVDWGIKKENIM